MPKLTDTQLVILSAAAKRKDGAVLPTPKSLKVKGTALTKTLEALHKRGLLEEKAASRQAAAWREAEDGRPMMLIITEAGLQAIDGAPAGDVGRQPTSTRTHTRKPRAKRKSVAKPKREKSASTARPGTKQALLIGLLKRKRGAAIVGRDEGALGATGGVTHQHAIGLDRDVASAGITREAGDPSGVGDRELAHDEVERGAQGEIKKAGVRKPRSPASTVSNWD